MVELRGCSLVLAERYPRLTLLFQAVGSFLLASEALSKCVPTVFVDTAGYAFTYPLARILGSKVVAYGASYLFWFSLATLIKYIA